MIQEHMSAAEYRRIMDYDRQKAASRAAQSALPKGKARLPQKGRTYQTEGMNRLESDYAAVLEARRRCGEIVAWAYEVITLHLADNTSYKPDFFIVMADGTIEIHETKGYWHEDARVKTKIAAKQFPWFIFRAVQHINHKWKYEVFGSEKYAK